MDDLGESDHIKEIFKRVISELKKENAISLASLFETNL